MVKSRLEEAHKRATTHPIFPDAPPPLSPARGTATDVGGGGVRGGRGRPAVPESRRSACGRGIPHCESMRARPQGEATSASSRLRLCLSLRRSLQNERPKRKMLVRCAGGTQIQMKRSTCARMKKTVEIVQIPIATHLPTTVRNHHNGFRS